MIKFPRMARAPLGTRNLLKDGSEWHTETSNRISTEDPRKVHRFRCGACGDWRVWKIPENDHFPGFHAGIASDWILCIQRGTYKFFTCWSSDRRFRNSSSNASTSLEAVLPKSEVRSVAIVPSVVTM